MDFGLLYQVTDTEQIINHNNSLVTSLNSTFQMTHCTVQTHTFACGDV